ncbi:TIGR02281 family clan AA aspartic protease [Litorivivens sp.]|uniref:retropepsin-like aspartic protease family protein n=1 Tax=Litorivivens sp. TaxID=2020868 RepID=UPI0035662261
MKRCLALLCLLAQSALADVQVNALFEGSAYLTVNGQQKLLRQGQSFQGVTLLQANTEKALLEIDGQQQWLDLSSRINASYRANTAREVVLHRDSELKYMTQVSINGRSIAALVDTGANLMALSSRHATQLGIDFKKGERAAVSTASGIAPSYRVTLRSVSVGGIVANNVPAVVIEGNFPQVVLLGMSYLTHVDMQERDNILTLRARY